LVNIRSVFRRFNESVCKTGHSVFWNGYHSSDDTDISTTNRSSTESSERRKLSYHPSIVGRECVSFFRDWRDKRNQDKQTRGDTIKYHCDILISNFITFNRTFYPDRTLEDYLSHFQFWDSIRQHFHNDIYKPLILTIENRKRMEDLEQDENYVRYEQELKNLTGGYNLKTQTLGGACDQCLQYHEDKTRKRYEKILHPDGIN